MNSKTSQQSETLKTEYNSRFKENTDYRDRVWKILCNDFFSNYIAADSTLLDLGAGWGEFSRNIAAAKKYSMDLNPDCGEKVEGYSEFIQQDCSEAWPLESGTLDVVFTSNFLEHLSSKHAIDLTLRETFRCLKDGGKIICLGPNIKYLAGPYWDYWDHYIPITDKSLAEALELQGFKVDIAIDRFLPYTMSGKNNPPVIAVKAYLKLPLFWPLFGKQFFIVAQK